MKYAPTWLLLSLCAFICCGCGANRNPDNHNSIPAEEIAAESARLNQWLDDVFDQAVERSPMRQTELGIRKDYGKWDDFSDAFEQREIKILRDNLEYMAAQFDTLKLNEQSLLSYRLFRSEGQRRLIMHEFRFHNYPINQMYGTHSWLPAFLINYHKIDSLGDANAYIARLEKLGAVLDQAIVNLEERAAKGIVAPAFVYPKALQDCRNIISGQPFERGAENSPLYNDFISKVDALETIDADIRAELTERAKDALLGSVQPGYAKLIEYLEGLQKNATDDAGVWKFPDGDRFYSAILQEHTTTSMTPQEIFNVGMSEIERIHNEMRRIIAKVGFDGDLEQFFEHMERSREFYYENTDEGRTAFLAATNAIIDSMRTRLDELFITKPRADLIVKRVEKFREQSAGGAFYASPAPDGSRPGIYYVNLFNMEQMSSYQMEALAYHEAIPGHHMQLSIAQELQGLPKFRTLGGNYTAYIEGWGLYSEYLPKEYGFYSDPYSDFGRLAMELWRACRLVVDVGIHAKRWTREQAIEFYADNTPDPHADCVRMVERHIVMPGQATAYKIGQLKILELREKARQTLGAAFDIREFHETALTNGAVPLDILELLVHRWMDERTTPPA